MIPYYSFIPRKVPVFSGAVLMTILKTKKKEYLLDCSLGKGDAFVTIRKTRDTIYIGDAPFSITEIKNLVKNTRRVYVLENNELHPLAIIENNNLYQLVLFESCRTPTVEISGIHMHRVLIDPLFDDAKRKILALNPKPGRLVLEVCTGLGYTTYWLIKKKCRIMATIEKSRAILQLAEYNPWSLHLKDTPIVLGDATKLIHEFDTYSVDYIVHDPPRYSIAPELYSGSFYDELCRVLRPKGKLLHYVGRPGEKRGKRFIKGILERLRNAGFTKVTLLKEIQCVTATKPLHLF